MKISIKNKIILDSENYASGKLIEINHYEESITSAGKIISEQIEFVWEVVCTKFPITKKKKGVVHLNPNKIFYQDYGMSYNLLTIS